MRRLYQGTGPLQGRSTTAAYNPLPDASPMTDVEPAPMDSGLRPAPAPIRGGAVLVVMVGVPGSGKSFLARAISETLGAELVQTDAVRKVLFRRPRYTAAETRAVYATCRRRLAAGLKVGRRVVFDATNLQESTRASLCRIAEQHGAVIVVVATYATETVIRARLTARQRGHDPRDVSDADWAVYLTLRRAAEPIGRPHLVANTCASPRPLLALLGRRLGTGDRDGDGDGQGPGAGE